MPLTEIEEDTYDTVVYLTDKTTDQLIEVYLKMEWPGEAKWVGGRWEPWSLDITYDPTWTFDCAVKVDDDGNTQIVNLSREQISKAMDKATDQYWEAYSNDDY